MEPGEREKKLNDDMVEFMRKRSETEAPRYTARLKKYLDVQQKRQRAEAALKHSAHVRKDQDRKKVDCDQKATDNCAHHEEEQRDREQIERAGGSGAQGREPVDACGCRRKRKRRCSKRRRRSRSCRRRRRRRRRSCRSKRSRRRSCSRRRRRRSCLRRRRKRRQCR